MDPLTPEEVTALELDGSLESSVKYKQRYIDTIRERERDEARKKLGEDQDKARWYDLIIENNEGFESGKALVGIGNLRRERDELQRKLEECERRLNA